jgi:tRNA(Ile)-lysidine synthetase-like protein
LKRRQTLAFPIDHAPARAAGPLAPGRWAQLARAVGLASDAPLVVALSGGADSVYLFHLVAAAKPRPRVVAVHVDHGLRGEESQGDAAFCARLAASLGIPFVRRSVELDVDAYSLEAQARAVRYQALSEEAARAGIATVLTGHHADDALETLLHRWTRGTDVHGLAGPRKKLVLRPSTRAKPERRAPGVLNATGGEVQIVRPLIAMRREEIRRILTDAGIAWREDGSNASARFTRNRIRNDLIPAIEATCGPGAVENLRAFGAAVEALEDRLAALTVPLSWSPPVFASARRPASEQSLGGSLRREALLAVPSPIRRRALFRLLVEGTGRPPSSQVLGLVLSDLADGRATRRSLPEAGACSSARISCTSSRRRAPHCRSRTRRRLDTFRSSICLRRGRREGGSHAHCRPPRPPRSRGAARRPPDLGRDRLPAARHRRAPLAEPGRDRGRRARAGAALVPPDPWVRFPRAGDRFRALGAPGRKP